jgi:hypothetical protein
MIRFRSATADPARIALGTMALLKRVSMPSDSAASASSRGCRTVSHNRAVMPVESSPRIRPGPCHKVRVPAMEA